MNVIANSDKKDVKIAYDMMDIFFQCAPNSMIFMEDLNTNVTRWTSAAVDYFDLPGEYVEDFGKIWIPKVHPDDIEGYREDLQEMYEQKKNTHCYEYRVKNKYDEYVWVHCEGRIYEDKENEIHIFMGMLNNYGTYMNFASGSGMYSLTKLHQDLAELYNRKMNKYALLLFGIDGFRQINDTEGYAYGNLVLKEIAEKITNTKTFDESFYKLDGDRFACVIQNADEKKLVRTFEKCQRIGENLEIENTKIELSITGGAVMDIAFFGEGYEAFLSAENTLRYAKEKKRKSVVIYSENLRKEADQEKSVIKALENSIHHNCKGFLLYYQPQIDAKTGELFGAEALLRFYDEEIGMVYPDKFIPILEKRGAMGIVGKWVLTTALEQMQIWYGDKIEKTISVNVSYMQFLEDGFIDFVKDEVKRLHYPSEKLIIELTESCKILDFESLREDIKKLKEDNIQFALDDFGTGYASVNVLRVLPVDWLKIEHLFVAEILHREEDKIIIEYLLKMARAMGVHVCIEGIENQDVLHVVESYQPDIYQGYYFDKPMDAGSFFEKYIK